ncbi:transposase [Deinococcus misasensis]|uniref:transposase n=1 Tax=Deinococcus misasensis TaxID=392413 RepID=UPI0009FEBBA4|nr:transposase [Deinococcus misasensis]
MEDPGAASSPRGDDRGKKVSGRKRHILVDTLGLIKKVYVHKANVHDRYGTIKVLNGLNVVFPRMQHVWADQGYKGKLVKEVKTHLGWTLEIVQQGWSGPKATWVKAGNPLPLLDIPEGFVVLKRHWVVERTFAWLGKSKRLAKDYKKLLETSENVIFEVMIRLMVRRLARST